MTDSKHVTDEQIRELREWCRPKLPDEKRPDQPRNSWAFLTSALDELLARREADEWRPIETAPARN